MYTKTIFALAGLVSYVAAVPLGAKRDIFWVTHTEETVTTVPVTTTIWVDPTDSAFQNQNFHARPTSEASAYFQPPPSASTSSAPVAPSSPTYSPPAAPTTTSTSSVYVAPTSSTTSTSQYVAPATTAAPATTQAAAPPAYSAPASSAAPASSPALAAGAAPASGNAISASSSSAWNCPANFGTAPAVSGMAAPGQSFSGDLTNFQDGMGACGCTNSDNDHIVAISQTIFDQYTPGGNANNNPLCGKKVTIEGAGGTFEAIITDRCVGCAAGDLDLPLPLFNAVTNNGDGRVHNQKWHFN